MSFILWFKDINIEDLSKVGGKNASLGEMTRELKKEGIDIPNGFALTSEAYFYFLEKNNLKSEIRKYLLKLNNNSIRDLNLKSAQIRNLILKSIFPKKLEEEILENYQKLSEEYKEKDTDVAVRSSATLEDLPQFSFAGMHETYLNIKGKKDLLLAIKKCFASLFLARAISYREKGGFDHFRVALSVGIQKMVRADLACSGVIFTLDTESGFPDVSVINGSWGLGEMLVKGKIIPDEFFVAEKMLLQGYPAIIKKTLGIKNFKMIYQNRKGKTKIIKTSKKEKESFVLSDEEILKLALWAIKVENHYSKKAGKWQPMDIEWAKDGKTGKLYFLQARPETVFKGEEKKSFIEYKLKKEGKVLLTGISIGEKIGQGKIRIIRDMKELENFKKGEVLVTKMTDPDMEPVMKIASAVVTDEGGRTCHAAIVSREIGVPCVVGTKNATKILEERKPVTVDCSQGEKGLVYKGLVPFERIEHKLEDIPKTKTKITLNIGTPDIAFKYSFLPVDGVGLAREEFIFASEIKVHPLALIYFDKLDRKIKKQINRITSGYKNKIQYFVEKLAQGVARIATAFHPREVIVRFSDFKTNEYQGLIGGKYFEPEESNPMIGWRGASRYYSEDFKEAFLLECDAIKKAREEYGLNNISLLVPFCRTIEEGKKTISLIRKAGLMEFNPIIDPSRFAPLKIYMMCEIPSNVILAKDFLQIFDGFSIGSNDLTQLTLGIDRDNALLTKIGDERDKAIKELIKKAVAECKTLGKYSGICGEAPSNYPEIVRFLIEIGIESISINPDVAIKTKLLVSEEEKREKV